jgi:short-subunit dehydrogenase involved in D-alanine esterification of teichoic acids
VARLLKKKTGNQNIFASRLDLNSLRSVKEFVDEFNENEQKLHVLINNAGQYLFYLFEYFYSALSSCEL